MPEAKEYCKEWVVQRELPTNDFLIVYMVSLTLIALAVAAAIRAIRKSDLRKILQAAGVAVHKLTNVAWEIERKNFKLKGLIVPMGHQILLYLGFSNSFCVTCVWTLTLTWVCSDTMRIYKVPILGQVWDWVFKDILRKDEQDNLSQASHFLIGCAVAVHLFAPVIAMTSIIFLVMGATASAWMTRAFGKSVVNMAGGRHSTPPSIEGSAAMLVVCFVLGCSIFHGIYLREYFVFFAALAATLFEYYEPFGISYNMGIPIVTSIALTVGYERTLSCGSSVVVE